MSDTSDQWVPLVPSSLEQHSRERYGRKVSDDPDIERAFRILYKKNKEDVKADTFTLLYSKDPEKETDKQGGDQEETSGSDKSMAETTSEPARVATPPEPPPPDMEKVRQTAWDEGFQMGKDEGFEKGLAEAAETVNGISRILDEIQGLKATLIAGYEKELIDLVMAIAEKVIYAKMEVNSGITESIVNALNVIPEPGETVITVNPQDYEYIEIVKEDFFESIDGLTQVSIVSDPAISTGGCRIETKSGEISSSVEERLEAVRQAVIQTMDAK